MNKQDRQLLEAANQGRFEQELEHQRLNDLGIPRHNSAFSYAALAGYYKARLARFVSQTKDLYDDKY